VKWYKQKKEIDEHDLPTEPMQYISQQPPTQAGAGKNAQLVLPAMPEKQRLTVPEKSWWEKKRPAKGEPVEKRKGDQPEARRGGTHRSTSRGKRRPSALPPLVRSFCFIAQLILVARIVLAIIQAIQSLPDNPDWARIITVLSDLLVQPLVFLVQQIQLSFAINEYIYILLAILFYGILARIVAGILEVTLGMR
jgi:hypothetical protein